ncbi:MAG: VCBS repeat-containing protein [Thermoanaerobaculia bacterium]|nr:VCBS repeat-containing protein [Thermoanaerobaculia bacterium]
MPTRSPSALCLLVFVFLFAVEKVAADPRFDLVADALDPQACNGSGCWTNHLRVTDLDLDGDLDLVLANYPDFFFGNNSPQPLVIYENNGAGIFTNVSTGAVGDLTGNLQQIAIGDVDGDGSPDIYGPSGVGGAPVLLINDGDGVFTDEASTRLPTTDFPAGAAARMGDVDNDGDLDIFSADGYAVAGPPFGRLYLNDGTGVFTESVGAIPSSISGVDIDDVEFFDADRDFDLDLVVNAHNGGTGALWLNDGSGTFAAGGSLAPPAGGSNHYNVTPCDVDGDGDLDLWIDNIGPGFTEQLLINDGSAGFTDETTTRVTGNPGVDDNGVICVDIDNDGDFDGVVVSLATTERLLLNDGTGNFTFVSDVFDPPGDCSLWGEFGDLDGDGRLDLVTGQGECSSSDEVYLGNTKVPVDSRAPVIVAVEELDTVDAGVAPPVRFAVSDSHVTDEGPRLQRAYVEIDPTGSPGVVEADFMGGDLFRAELPAEEPGSMSYRVCAEDLRSNGVCSPTFSYSVVPQGEIFSDGFETGNTSAWSN